jgi:hypothetical protein
MDKKLIEHIVGLVDRLESFRGDEKNKLIGRLKYMPDWQLEELKDGLIKMHSEEEKFKSDVSRLELKYEIQMKDFIEENPTEE